VPFFCPRNCFGFKFWSASSTISVILFCLVSCRLARVSHCKIFRLSDLLKFEKYSLALFLFLNSLSKSLGIIKASASSKIVQEPFCFAVSTVLKPAFVILNLPSSNGQFFLYLLSTKHYFLFVY
jgi:hypothetical protein